ncbi:glutamate-1-semialdehyde 2,1-aminomutase [Lacrimispora sphenoides]|jgi:glutamate-1-semialdehyde 2,1-aminomutase|uniref:glutamate-1-semialdehyde 2,1-aminomutase n=1 Tax=Lacrimispora sphenoides TaxID=29370 RepID=UPI0008BD3E1E|nr:glutamate-1-semialdehyde 2,1-aminomutase [Lacrimispora sphenoides]SET69844.1 glutamate-1-semialdehyde 2,1-aminomutase [Lacrimispora sphenoides]
MTKSEQLFERAVKHLPGGVNSPVRAFLSVGGSPRFIESADGAYIYDVDGNKYIDYINSWGPMILGHNHEIIRKAVIEAAQKGLSYGAATEVEVEMAELLCEIVPCFEMVRMVNSGTEAVMSAIRAARGYTRRSKIIKFEGCYHGHSDGLLVKAGSGVMAAGIPDSLGVPSNIVKDTLQAKYNDLDSVIELFEQNKDEIAAIIVEPVAANMGVVLPQEGFLQGLRELCTKHRALLIFDEVITGFRLSLSGAQGYYNVMPDLATFGKIIGGGMPVGCYGGRREIMEMVAPVGPVYQAGTLSGNPVAMAAGMAQLKYLKEHPEVYTKINELGEYFRNKVDLLFGRYNIKYQVTGIGSLACFFFANSKVTDYETAKMADTKEYARYFRFMLEHGVYIAPAQFEAMFFSYAHTHQDVEDTLLVIEQYLKSI